MEEAEQCCTTCMTTELRSEDDGFCTPCRRLRYCDRDRSTCATTAMCVAGDDEVPRTGGRKRSGCSSKRSWPLLVLLLMTMIIAATTTIAAGARIATGNANGKDGVCPECGDRACQPSGECCHPNCLDGCSGPTASNCTACRHFIVNNTDCVVTCPEGTYEFLQKRCITEQECRMIRRPREQPIEMHDYPYNLFGNQCILESRFLVGCNLTELNSVFTPMSSKTAYIAWEPFKPDHWHTLLGYYIYWKEGSTQNVGMYDGEGWMVRYINVTETEKSASLIVNETLGQSNIDLQAVKVNNSGPYRTYTQKTILLSLKPSTNYAHYVKAYTCLQPFAEAEFSSNSNNNMATELKTFGVSLDSKSASIAWEPLNDEDDVCNLLGYFIYWKKALIQDDDVYDSEDWMVKYINVTDSEKSSSVIVDETLEQTSTDAIAVKVNYSDPYSIYTQKTILLSLKPFTQYVYYMKTYTTSVECSILQSKLQYFMTLPDQPSAVQDLNVYSNASDSLVIIWQPPLEPNSNLSHYMIIGVLEPYNVDNLKDMDFCKACLSCMCPPFWSLYAPQDLEDVVSMKYNIDDERVNNAYTRFKRNVPATEQIFVMRELRHFSMYNIIVMACREKDVNSLGNECSTESTESMQTLMLENASTIPAESLKIEMLPSNGSLTTVKLHWSEPVNPNGVVIAYIIELTIFGQPWKMCQTPEEFLAEGNASILTELSPGSYSVKVRPMTLAGECNSSPTLYFNVPEWRMRLWEAILISVVIITLTVYLVCYFVGQDELMVLLYTVRFIFFGR